MAVSDHIHLEYTPTGHTNTVFGPLADESQFTLEVTLTRNGVLLAHRQVPKTTLAEKLVTRYAGYGQWGEYDPARRIFVSGTAESDGTYTVYSDLVRDVRTYERLMIALGKAKRVLKNDDIPF